MDSEEVLQGQPLKKMKFEGQNYEVSSVSKEAHGTGNDNEEESAPRFEKPIKPITPYIAFVKDYKEKHGTVSFKELGSVWKEMAIEEKHKYVKIAEEDLNRYREENARYVNDRIIIGLFRTICEFSWSL